jgi:integrase
VAQEKAWPTRLFLSEPRERVRFLSDEELSAVLEAAEKAGPWMYAAVVTSIATGVRMGELLRLEWKDLDLDKGTLTVHISKNTKRRLVHLNAPAIAALKNLRRAGVVGPKWVFVKEQGEDAGQPADKFYLSYRWQHVRKEAGLADFRWHDLRHCTASFLAQAGATLAEIGHVLGHSSPSITAKYAHLVAGAPVTGADKLAAKLTSKRPQP